MTLDSGSYVWLMAESLVLTGPKSILKSTLEDQSRVVVWPQASHTTPSCLSLSMCKISVSGKGSQRSLLSLVHSALWLLERGSSSLLPPVSLPQFISSPEATPLALRSELCWQWEEGKRPVRAGVWCKIHKCSLKYSLTRVEDICCLFFVPHLDLTQYIKFVKQISAQWPLSLLQGSGKKKWPSSGHLVPASSFSNDGDKFQNLKACGGPVLQFQYYLNLVYLVRWWRGEELEQGVEGNGD